QLHGLFRKVYRRDLRYRAGKIDRVCPDPAPNFQDFLALPPRELRKSRYVIFHKVFSRLYLVEVFLRAHRRGRMPDVAGTLVPIILYSRNLDLGENHRLVLTSLQWPTFLLVTG